MLRTTFAFLLGWLLLTGCQTHEEAAVAEALFQPMDLGKEVNVSCFHEEPNGSLWIGLDGEGLAYKETPTSPCRFYNKLAGTLPADVVICSYKDTQGRIWFGTFGSGLFYWQDGSFHQPEHDALKDKMFEYPSGFLEDAHHTLWVATLKHGLARVDTTGRVTLYGQENSALPTNYITDLKSFDGKTIYVATGWGLVVLNAETGTLAPLTDSQGDEFLRRQLVRILYAADNGRLWIGTRTGLYIYDRNARTYIRLTTDDGLGDNFVKAITADRQGNVWVTSDHSVTRITPQLECQAFHPQDGIGDGTFHVRAALCLAGGEMVFGTSKGCLTARVNPATSTTTGWHWAIWLVAIAAVVLACATVVALQKKRKRRRREEVKPAYAEIEPTHLEVSSVDEQLKEKAMRVVEEHMDDSDFSVEQLSATLGMSRGNLYKRLTAITGRTPQEFIRIIRVKRGRQLLEQSGESVQQVAWRVGMSPKQFSKYFKEEYGMLPSDFVRNLSIGSAK